MGSTRVSEDKRFDDVESNFKKAYSRPRGNNKYEYDLNDKELAILKQLLIKTKLSSLEICTNIGWLSVGRAPSAYNRYLQKFLNKKWIRPNDVVLNGKRNIKYNITKVGKKAYNEAISFNTKYRSI